jgi:putative holliday junction resolvase
MGKRILALDPGTKRIGVALSDELGWIAQPLETIERRSLDADLGRIRGLVQDHDVERVLVGLPVRMDGTLGPESAAVQQFMDALGRTLAVPVEAWDERLTTRAAEDLLIAANVSRRKRKGVVDRVAAAILLESYLRARGAGEEAVPADDHDPEGG